MKIAILRLTVKTVLMLVYMLRWQLSTPILAIVPWCLAVYFGIKNYWWAAVITNLVGSWIIYPVDKFIFRKFFGMLENWLNNKIKIIEMKNIVNQATFHWDTAKWDTDKPLPSLGNIIIGCRGKTIDLDSINKKEI